MRGRRADLGARAEKRESHARRRRPRGECPASPRRTDDGRAPARERAPGGGGARARREGARARHLARERPSGGAPRPSGRERARRRALPARRPRRPDRGNDRLHDRAGARKSPALRGPVRDPPDDGRGGSGRPGLLEARQADRPRLRRRRSASPRERAGLDGGAGRPGMDARRVGASPLPKRIFEIRPVRWLLEKGTIVICGGGGGIPTVYGEDGKLRGVEAVIDKDRVASLLAQQLEADFFIMATDVPAVLVGWGTRDARAIRRASPAVLSRFDFTAGSMGPKVEAARDFAERTGKTAAIGALEDIPCMLRGEAGTLISNEVATLEWESSQETLFRE